MKYYVTSSNKDGGQGATDLTFSGVMCYILDALAKGSDIKAGVSVNQSLNKDSEAAC